VPDPPVWLAIGFAVALIVFALVARRKWTKLPAGAAAAGLFAILLWQPWPAPTRLGTLELTTIDVGQGDSHLLVFPGGKSMLVDGGGILQFGRVRKANLDIGEDVVSPYLWSRGVRKLERRTRTRITSAACPPCSTTSARKSSGPARTRLLH
jgi:competence protein ComEC